jgi:hypothetical protein
MVEYFILVLVVINTVFSFFLIKDNKILTRFIKNVFWKIKANFTFLFFVQKQEIKIKLNYRSIYDDGSPYYLLDVIICSHQVFYKVYCKGYVTIIPQDALIIDSHELSENLY